MIVLLLCPGVCVRTVLSDGLLWKLSSSNDSRNCVSLMTCVEIPAWGLDVMSGAVINNYHVKNYGIKPGKPFKCVVVLNFYFKLSFVM